MKIELNFDIGDSLYYIREIGCGGELCALEICRQKNGIDGIKLQKDEDGNIFAQILTDGNEDLPGSQYACLTQEQALEWCRKNRPGAILLPGRGTVKGIYFNEYGERTVVDVPLSISGIEEYIGGSPAMGNLDINGYFSVYSESARRNGAPITLFLLDANGNSVDAMFGAFLVLRLNKTDDVLTQLVDVDPDILND